MIDLLFLSLKSVVEQGFIYALVVFGVHISSEIIAFDDLAVEGSFSAGGALAAFLAASTVNCWWALPLAFCLGCCIGVVTCFLHVRCGLNNLLSGIVVTTSLFSINLKWVGTHVAFAEGATIFDQVPPLAILFLLIGSCWLFMQWFLQTEVGFLLRALGCNPRMLTNLEKSVGLYKAFGLMLSNALSALAGALFVHYLGFFSITGGIGILIIALASHILGKIICKKSLGGLILGAIAYQAVIALTVELQVDPAWNKLIAAVMIVLLIVFRGLKDSKG